MNQRGSVLITGCSSGIGRWAALELMERGYHVIASARKPVDVSVLNSDGFDAIQLDLDDSGSIRDGFQEALKRSENGIYALFNNGAWGLPGAVEDLSRDALRAQFETNLFGTIELSNLVIRHMRQRGGEGRVIHNSSILGLVALPYRGAYTASKFALEGIADTQRLELRGSGIQISLIEPGPIMTKFRANAYRAYRQWIDRDNSRHSVQYRILEERLLKSGPAGRFTLPPEAVYECVLHALESSRPKARYYVTLPTYAFAVLRRVLPAKWLDMLLVKGI